MSSTSTESDWIDPDDAPELTEEWFDQADFMIGREVIRRGRGRPAGSTTGTKEHVSLRIERDVLAHFKPEEPGWRARINEALRRAAGL